MIGNACRKESPFTEAVLIIRAADSRLKPSHLRRITWAGLPLTPSIVRPEIRLGINRTTK